MKLQQLLNMSIAEDFYQTASNYRDSANYDSYMYNEYKDYFVGPVCTNKEFKKLIEDMYELVWDIKYYEGLIELSADRISFDSCDDPTKYDYIELFRAATIEDLIAEFEQESNAEIYLEGRSGRHVCVKDNVYNALRINELKELQQKLQKKYIDTVNKYINSLNNKKD